MSSDRDDIYMDRRQALGLAAAASVAGLFNLSPIRAESRGKLPIGMNLAGIADWEPGFPFLNAMWGARIWLTASVTRSGPWDTRKTGEMEIDENGYPLEVPFRVPGIAEPQYPFTILPNTLRGGKYVILYDGDGAIGTIGETKAVDRQPGRIEIGMRHRGGDALEGISIFKSTRGNHVRNIRILPIDQEKAELERNPFRQEILDFCAPWHCLRFMDWLSTNNSINASWSKRKVTAFYTQTGANGDSAGIFSNDFPAWQTQYSSGLATELCIKLSNLTKTHAWLCVPHMADDDYIFQMAKLTKEQLDPSLKVYVEYSNEVWNWQFLQAHWMMRSELASDLVVGGGGQLPWKGGKKPRTFRNGIVTSGAGEGADHPERIGALFSRCFKIWENVFSGRDRERLVRVCAVQAAWEDASQRTLNWVMQHGGCEALSPAGYFGPDDEVYAKWEKAGESLTAGEVIADMKQAIRREGKIAWSNARMAKRAGVKLVTYEGGQHIQPQGQGEKSYNKALGAAQTHPAMYDLYRDNLRIYAGLDCELFCAFNSIGSQGSRWGSWGHLERYGQDPATAPKYRALLDANTPRAPL